MSHEIVDYLLELLEKKGSDIQYGNEDVTQLEHALQCAELAEESNKSDAFITAALLHDIGHLIYEDKDPIHDGKDGLHEDLGANYLSKYFGEEVTLPIRAHVESKRYLAAIEDGYYEELSEASKKSLQVQGGIFFSTFLQVRHFRIARRDPWGAAAPESLPSTRFVCRTR